MRAAASGMSREDGYAAMKAEADELKAGKPPKQIGVVEPAGNGFRGHVQYREEGALRHIHGPWRLQAALRCPRYCRSTLFGIKEGPKGVSLAMYPLVGFAFQAQGYVSKEQRVLSDAPSGQFSEPLARRLPGICGGIFPSVSF